MKLVKYQGLHPECLDGFPEDCERSKAGALHMRPGRTLLLTDDEYGHLKAQRPDIAKSCVVLRDNVPKPKSEESASEAVEKSEEDSAPAEDSSPSMDDEGDDDEMQ